MHPLFLFVIASIISSLQFATIANAKEARPLEDEDNGILPEALRGRSKCLTLSSFTTLSNQLEVNRVGYREITAACNRQNLDDSLRRRLPSPMLLRVGTQEEVETFTDVAALKPGWEERVSVLGVNLHFTHGSSSTFTLRYTSPGCDAPDDLAGYGGGEADSTLKYEVKYHVQVRNRKFFVPSLYIRSAKVWLMLVTVEEPDAYLRETLTFGSTYPVAYTRRRPRTPPLAKEPVECAIEFSTATPLAPGLRGHHHRAFDVYLAQAPTLSLAREANWALTGAPQLPPFWALGFMASRWGWSSREYISEYCMVDGERGMGRRRLTIDCRRRA